MKINLHIEKLHIYTMAENKLNQKGIVRDIIFEIQENLKMKGLSSHLDQDGNFSNMSGSEIIVQNESDKYNFGQQVAQSIYGVIGRE